MNLKGTVYFLLFILIMALSGVYQAKLSQSINPVCFLLVSSFISMTIFSFLNFRQNKLEFIYKALKEPSKVLWLNISSLVAWFCYIYAIKFLEPAIAVIIANASGPILVIIFSRFLQPGNIFYRIEKFAAIGIIVSLIFIVSMTLHGKSAISSSNHTKLILGIILAFLGGIGQVIFSLFSSKLTNSKFLPNEILVWTFPLIFLISCFSIDKETIYQLLNSSHLLFSVFILALSGLVIPTYFYQKAVPLIEPISISVLYILEPVIIFLGQIFDPRLQISYYSYFGVFMIVSFSTMSVLGRYYKNKH